MSLWPAFIDILFICTVFVHPCVYASVLYSSNARYVSIFCYKLHTVKETPQTTDEEVGAFTKLIEAMGFTGPLKYNKWVKKQPLNLVLLNNYFLYWCHPFVQIFHKNWHVSGLYFMPKPSEICFCLNILLFCLNILNIFFAFSHLYFYNCLHY